MKLVFKCNRCGHLLDGKIKRREDGVDMIVAGLQVHAPPDVFRCCWSCLIKLLRMTCGEYVEVVQNEKR